MQHNTVDESIRLALQVCIEQNIMKEYLEKNGAEVQNMLLTEWNWNDAFRVRGEEKFAAGKAEGEIEGEQKALHWVDSQFDGNHGMDRGCGYGCFKDTGR